MSIQTQVFHNLLLSLLSPVFLTTNKIYQVQFLAVVKISEEKNSGLQCTDIFVKLIVPTDLSLHFEESLFRIFLLDQGHVLGETSKTFL